MPKVTEEHSIARREQILAAAVACFAEKGFHKTSMKDICSKAQLSPGAVYSYFASKDEIIENVCQVGDERNMAIFHATRERGGSLKEQVEFNLGGYRSMMDQPGAEACVKADLMFMAETLSNERLHKLWNRNYRNIIRELCEAGERWKKAGYINRNLNTRAVAQVLFSMVLGLGIQKVVGGDVDMDAYFDAVMTLILGDFNVDE